MKGWAEDESYLTFSLTLFAVLSFSAHVALRTQTVPAAVKVFQ